MASALYYLAMEDSVAARFMTAQQRAGAPPSGANLPGSPGDCPATGQINLPTNITQSESFGSQFLDSPQGALDQVRAVAGVWNHAADLVEDIRASAQYGTRQLLEQCQGVGFNNFGNYFAGFVGVDGPAETVDDNAPTMANVAAACRMLGQACADYANGINDAWNKYWEPFFECSGWMYDRVSKNPNMLAKYKVPGYARYAL